MVFVVLGIFTINAGQPVKIDLFFTLYEQVDLAIVAFVTTFIGFVFGAVLISFYLIREKKVGSNATFIGLNEAIVPRAFSSVTGPVYLRQGYRKIMFLIMEKILTSG